MKALMIVLAVMGLLAGCNDSGDNTTTIEEAPVYEIGTNGNPIIVVQDIDGLVIVDLVTGQIVDLVTGQVEEQPYNVVVQNVGTGGVVSIKTSPYIPPPPPPPTEPATP